MTVTEPCNETPRDYRKHGLNAAKAALKEWGSRAIDLRTRAGRSLLAWRDQLIEDSGRRPMKVMTNRKVIVSCLGATVYREAATAFRKS
jgi:hypothetical protein